MNRLRCYRSASEMRWRERQRTKIEDLARECAKADDGFTVREQRVVDWLPTRDRYEE